MQARVGDQWTALENQEKNIETGEVRGKQVKGLFGGRILPPDRTWDLETTLGKGC